MTQARIDLPKKEIAEFCKKWGVSEFSFFGSVPTDDFRPDSDIDILATLEEDARHTLFDLVSRRSIESSSNHIRRDTILNSAEAIYAA